MIYSVISMSLIPARWRPEWVRTGQRGSGVDICVDMQCCGLVTMGSYTFQQSPPHVCVCVTFLCTCLCAYVWMQEVIQSVFLNCFPLCLLRQVPQWTWISPMWLDGPDIKLQGFLLFLTTLGLQIYSTILSIFTYILGTWTQALTLAQPTSYLLSCLLVP